MIDRESGIPLYIQLKDEILNKIDNNIWDIDSKIPTEMELMNKYKIGRATVRQALSILVNEGYLYKKHGIGTFIAGKKPSLGFEPLISLTFLLKQRGINPINYIDKKQIITAANGLLKELKLNKEQEIFYLRRIIYDGILPLAIEDSYFNKSFADGDKELDLEGSLAAILLQDLKLNITKVEQIIIPRKGEESEKQILKINNENSVLELKRWIYIDEQKEPYFYLKFVIPSNI
jgi:GntR family transcriptional regulator